MYPDCELTTKPGTFNGKHARWYEMDLGPPSVMISYEGFGKGLMRF